jgi:hypothetical protein
VWAVMAKPHSSVASQREEIIAAIRASPPCSEGWCDKGKATLTAWQTEVSARVPALNPGTVECSAAGCFVTITVTDPLKWRDVSDAIPDVTSQHNWSGPSIRSGPDYQTHVGSVTALWAVLPATDNNEEGAGE